MSGGGPWGLFGLPCLVAKQLEEFPAPQTFLYPVSHLHILHVDFSYESFGIRHSSRKLRMELATKLDTKTPNPS